jgi:hypothetical protein
MLPGAGAARIAAAGNILAIRGFASLALPVGIKINL